MKKTRTMQLALSVTAALGVAVLAVGPGAFYVYAIGGLLLVGGLGGLLTTAFVGGMGQASCPACNASFPVAQVRRSRVAPCPGCGVWLEGAMTMAAVPRDRIAAKPTFCTQLPAQFQWSNGCAVCSAPVVQTIKVKSSPRPGVVVLPVSVSVLSVIDVPVCGTHRDLSQEVWIQRVPNGNLLSFRSLPALERFETSNQLGPTEHAAAFWAANETAQPTA